MKKLLGNAVSINMIDLPGKLDCKPITEAEFVIGAADAESVWGHEQSAPLLAALIGREVQYNRTSVHMDKGDVMYLAQYAGPRLPEGATELPDGARFNWVVVTVE